MDFKKIIEKYQFENYGLIDTIIKENGNKYVLKFEGYAYVLYKEIEVKVVVEGDVMYFKHKVAIAHFRDENKLDLFLEILFDEFKPS